MAPNRYKQGQTLVSIREPVRSNRTTCGINISIELNTSPHRYGLTDSMPSAEILRLYKNLGGSIVTIGTDSHAPEHLGTYIMEAKKQLKKTGFHHFCTYEKMEPVFHYL